MFVSQKIVKASGDNPWDLQLEFSGRSCLEWVGFFSYEMGAFSDPEKRIPYRFSGIPLALFFQPSVVIEADHLSNEVRIYSELLQTMKERITSFNQLSVFLVQQAKRYCGDLLPISKSSESCTSFKVIRPGDKKELYFEKILAAQELIRNGDIYQVNLSQEFIFEGLSDPFVLFESIVQSNPAPFMAFFRLEDSAIISSSPERFLQKQGNRLQTRPIKGTIARGKTVVEDYGNKDKLLLSSKDRAELLMITDLMRNDLAKVSLPGSVEVEKLWHLESYANVHHLLSIVRSIVDPKHRPLEVLRACFPGGSITGCPKLRAMEVIDSLEDRPRGIYTGSMGYFTGIGDFDFNIAIRTMLWTSSRVNIQLGGAIVSDSHPESEYLETLQKGDSLFQAINRL